MNIATCVYCSETIRQNGNRNAWRHANYSIFCWAWTTLFEAEPTDAYYESRAHCQ